MCDFGQESRIRIWSNPEASVPSRQYYTELFSANAGDTVIYVAYAHVNKANKYTVHKCICMYVYMYIYTFCNMSVYISCICTHDYAYTYMYVYTQKSVVK